MFDCPDLEHWMYVRNSWLRDGIKSLEHSYRNTISHIISYQA
jgi:hypothetical protein